MITVSVCMIVKNEEAVLARCLDSLKEIADEIVIVDTGSDDATREIAARYTDKLYDYEWKDDFADARNYAFSKATMDYIYSADADEVLDQQNRAQFLALKQVLMPEIDIVQMLYCGQFEHNTVYNFDEEYRPKLYKRLRCFRFEGPIHEKVVTDPLVFDSDIRIFHKPHTMHTDRDLAVYLKNYGGAQAPSLPSRLLIMLAKELFISGSDEHFQSASPLMESIFEEDERSPEDLLAASCVLAHACRISGDIPSFFKYAMKAVLIEDGCSEICMELGAYYESRGDLSEAHTWYYNAAYETGAAYNIRLGGSQALLALARVCDAADLHDKAEEYRREAAERL